jgi:hypothetical protein
MGTAFINQTVNADRLRDLTRHIWFHQDHPDCGFMEMEAPQRRLYMDVIGDDRPVEERVEEHCRNGRERP